MKATIAQRLDGDCFDHWFKDSEFIAFDGKTLTIRVCNDFDHKWFEPLYADEK